MPLSARDRQSLTLSLNKRKQFGTWRYCCATTECAQRKGSLTVDEEAMFVCVSAADARAFHEEEHVYFARRNAKPPQGKRTSQGARAVSLIGGVDVVDSETDDAAHDSDFETTSETQARLQDEAKRKAKRKV